MILGLALCFLAVIGAFFAGHWMGYDKGLKQGISIASGRTPVTPLRPKVEQRARNRGGDGGLAS